MATYLPQEYINSNYIYTTDGNSYLIRTNQNCYTNYNTTYCDCFYIYPQLDYLKSQVNQCSRSVSYSIPYQTFTSDVYYRIDLDKIMIYL